MIKAVELVERRATTYEERCRRLNALYAFARSQNMRLPPDDDAPVYERWRRLKEHYERTQRG